MNKQISYKIVSLVFGILILCFAIAFYAVGWDEPTQPPPTCPSGTPGCDPPLNVGPVGQAKAGGLAIHTSSEFENPAEPYGLLIPYGNVGIGTTTPGATLDVHGTVQMFGAWESKSDNTVYQAPSDGLVIAVGKHNNNTIYGRTDSNYPPATLVSQETSVNQQYQSIIMPVKKNDHWRVENANISVYWLPLGQ